ncbi:hypothetical protein PR048_015727 [Dryococelus australis]|uniref:Uncharacterized protein n=1 Tax=Dryococelus australis TaxID=614101 RepID=A0ABQ9HHR2_9NEOP|nr:hypothetical protein PR048_015727 [Dryococelus australis]
MLLTKMEVAYQDGDRLPRWWSPTKSADLVWARRGSEPHDRDSCVDRDAKPRKATTNQQEAAAMVEEGSGEDNAEKRRNTERDFLKSDTSSRPARADSDHSAPSDFSSNDGLDVPRVIRFLGMKETLRMVLRSHSEGMAKRLNCSLEQYKQIFLANSQKGWDSQDAHFSPHISLPDPWGNKGNTIEEIVMKRALI